jgi:hypothetical protein
MLARHFSCSWQPAVCLGFEVAGSKAGHTPWAFLCWAVPILNEMCRSCYSLQHGFDRCCTHTTNGLIPHLDCCWA